MRRRGLKGRGILFYALIFLLGADVMWVQAAGAKGVSPEMVSGLQDRLNKNVKAESLIRARMTATFALAARPHSAYLLHQKSLGLQDNRAQLQNLRIERVALIREIEHLSGQSGFSATLLQDMSASFLIENARRDSGSPVLSFQEARWVHLANESFKDPSTVVLYRVVMAGFLLMVFSLPLIAIFRRGEPVALRKNLVRVFPMFTVNGAHGRREVLKIQVDPRKTLLSYLSPS